MSVQKTRSGPAGAIGRSLRGLALRLVRLAVTATVVATIVFVLDALLLRGGDRGAED